MNEAYKELLNLYSEIKLLHSITGVLYWDMNTYMPSNSMAVEYRSKEFQYISEKIHALITSTRVGDLLAKCNKDQNLTILEKRNVELINRWYLNESSLPLELVGKLAKQSNKTLEIWKKAKAKNDFKLVEKDLDAVFQLNKTVAERYAEVNEVNEPFNALIDVRDKGFNVEILSNLFNESKAFLVPFIKKITRSEIKPSTEILKRFVPKSKQIKMVEDLVRFLEYDIFSNDSVGNLAEVEHPLTIGCGLRDVRVTVKYHENDVMSTFFAGAHECGHALHGLQGKLEWYNQPIYSILSPSFGESQSRFLENIVVGSRSFWQYYYPTLQKSLSIFDNTTLDTFYLAINRVKPSLLRVSADEVTYMLHIIIRFEIERDWFAGKITTEELPEIWNEKYEKYLGIEVTNDSQGVMQDLHWYSQYYGYFFGYGVGDIIASQLASRMKKDMPDWEIKLSQGIYSPIRQWLKVNVHELGNMYDCLDLVEHITGEKLTYKHHKNYLVNKYSELYNI